MSTDLPIVPPSLDYTPASPDYLPASDMKSDPSEDPSSEHIPLLLATSPFLSSSSNSSDRPSPDTYDADVARWRRRVALRPSILPASPGVRRRRALLISYDLEIPFGRPYRYHPNGPVYMLTARKRVGPLPTHRLAVRQSVDYSLSDHFTFDDSPRDSLSYSSSETSSGSSLDTASDSSSLDHPSPAPSLGMRSSHQLCLSVPSIPRSPTPTTERPSHFVSAEPSRKRSRSPTTCVPVSTHVPGALSSIRAGLLPPRKRIRSSDSIMDLEISLEEGSEPSVPRETDLGMDIDYDIEGKVGINVRVDVEIVARYVVEARARNTVKGGVDRVIESVQREQGHRIVGIESAIYAMTERVAELERDNMRLRGTMSVEG
ncbi:hypothetical protein Tco_0454099 [Tanacetum coccineum]